MFASTIIQSNEEAISSIREKIKLYQEKYNNLESKRRIAQDKKENIRKRIEENKKSEQELEDEYRNKTHAITKTMAEIGELKLIIKNEEYKERYLNEDARKIEQKKDGKTKQALLLQHEINQIKNKISSLQLSIRPLDDILARKEPQASYKIDGEYCINNIYHCTNHPPRKVLINGAEIYQYKHENANAAAKKSEILSETRKLQQNIHALSSQYEAEEKLILALTENYAALELKVKLLTQHICEENALLGQEESTLSNLTADSNLLKSNWDNTKKAVDDLLRQFSRIEFELEDLQKQIKDIESLISRFKDEASQLESEQKTMRDTQLEQLAMQEIAQEDANQVSEQSQYPLDSQSSTSDNTILQRLKQLAMQELREEKKALYSQANRVANNISGAVSDAKQLAGNFLNTAKDVWPNAVAGLLTNTIYNGSQMNNLSDDLDKISFQENSCQH